MTPPNINAAATSTSSPPPTTTRMPSSSSSTSTSVDISLTTSVAGITFDKPLGNLPNPLATTTSMLTTIASSSSTGCYTTRTVCPGFVHDDTLHQWKPIGSSGTTTTTASNNTINCLGYSCHDFDYYCQSIAEIQSSHPDTVAIFSITGTPQEVKTMLQQISSLCSSSSSSDASTSSSINGDKLLVEINLSCPNIPGKPPVAYDPIAIRNYLQEAVLNVDATTMLKIGVKLAPYLYETQFVDICNVLNDIPNLSFVTTINTIGCGLAIDIDTEKPVLCNGAASSYGGLGGPAVHHLALGNVRRLRQLLRNDIDIIGVGGVNSGAGVFSFLLCGASAVMMASTLLTEGVECFDRIEQELLTILRHKGYTSLDQVKGKLKDGNNTMSCPAKSIK